MACGSKDSDEKASRAGHAGNALRVASARITHGSTRAQEKRDYQEKNVILTKYKAPFRLCSYGCIRDANGTPVDDTHEARNIIAAALTDYWQKHEPARPTSGMVVVKRPNNAWEVRDAAKVDWSYVTEWKRTVPTDIEMWHDGFDAHFGDQIPCDRNMRVEVFIGLPSSIHTGIADDIDWRMVRYWRAAR